MSFYYLRTNRQEGGRSSEIGASPQDDLRIAAKHAKVSDDATMVPSLFVCACLHQNSQVNTQEEEERQSRGQKEIIITISGVDLLFDIFVSTLLIIRFCHFVLQSFCMRRPYSVMVHHCMKAYKPQNVNGMSSEKIGIQESLGLSNTQCVRVCSYQKAVAKTCQWEQNRLGRVGSESESSPY